nr:MAG TPA: hypothetical protein [Bacteriophage sp.]
MLVSISWLLVKSYIILILTASIIRSEEILYDFLCNTVMYHVKLKYVKRTVIALNIFIIVCASLWTKVI